MCIKLSVLCTHQSLSSGCAGKSLPQETDTAFIVPGATKCKSVWGVVEKCVLYCSKCNMNWRCVFSGLVDVNGGVYIGY